MADLSEPLRTMKRILILLLALMPSIIRAQGFIVDNEEKSVSWSKIYDTTMSQEDIYKAILAYDVLNNVVMYDNIIAGDIPPVRLDYESLGYSRMRLPLFLTNDRFGARLVLIFKDGRYKAQAHNMYFVGEAGSITSGKTPIYTYTDVNFKEAPRIISTFLEGLTTFAPMDEEW